MVNELNASSLNLEMLLLWLVEKNDFNRLFKRTPKRLFVRQFFQYKSKRRVSYDNKSFRIFYQYVCRDYEDRKPIAEEMTRLGKTREEVLKNLRQEVSNNDSYLLRYCQALKFMVCEELGTEEVDRNNDSGLVYEIEEDCQCFNPEKLYRQILFDPYLSRIKELDRNLLRLFDSEMN